MKCICKRDIPKKILDKDGMYVCPCGITYFSKAVWLDAIEKCNEMYKKKKHDKSESSNKK